MKSRFLKAGAIAVLAGCILQLLMNMPTNTLRWNEAWGAVLLGIANSVPGIIIGGWLYSHMRRLSALRTLLAMVLSVLVYEGVVWLWIVYYINWSDTWVVGYWIFLAGFGGLLALIIGAIFGSGVGQYRRVMDWRGRDAMDR